MTLGTLLGGLFRTETKRATESREDELKRAVRQAAKIVAAYGKVLSDDQAEGFIQDVKRLPNSKEQIKAAIQILLKVTKDTTMHQHLRSGYTALSAYQPLTPNQKHALRQWESERGRVRSMSNSDLQKMARSIAESGDVVGSLRALVLAEMNVLQQEFDAEASRS